MKEYCGEEFSKLEWSGEEFQGILFEDCLFTDCKATEVTIRNCQFSGCRFEKCRIVAPKFQGTQVLSSDFSQCDLSGWIGRRCWMSGNGRWVFCLLTA